MLSMTSICEGKGCPIKETCLRHTRPIADWRTRYQFLSPPYRNGECTEFIVTKKDQSYSFK